MIIKNDTNRIERYLELLSEEIIKEFEKSVEANSDFEVYDESFDIYRDFKKSLFGSFDDKDLQYKLERFNESFEKLENLLSKAYKWDYNIEHGWYPRRWKLEKQPIIEEKEIKDLLNKFDLEYQILIGAFREYFKSYKEENFVSKDSDSRFIVMENNDFFYGKDKSKIKFKNHNTKYYFLFCSLYDLSKGKEPIKYNELISHLNKKYKQKNITEKSIIGIIHNSLERNHEKYNLQLITSKNENLIEVIRGKGISFYNHKI